MGTDLLFCAKNDKISLYRAHNDSVDSKRFLPHYHERCEIILILSGNVSYIVEGKTYRLKKWDIVLSRPMQIHTILPDDHTKYDRYVAIIDHKALPEDIWGKLRHGPDVFPCADNDRITELFTKLNFYSAQFSEANFANLAFSAISEVMYNLSLFNPEDRVISINPVVSRALAYIKENLTTLENINELCQNLYITKSHLHHLFTEHLQITPAKYVMTKKLMLAQRKIKKGLKPTEVYSECGFSDYATFFRNYKKFFGYSPIMEGKIERPEEIIT